MAESTISVDLRNPGQVFACLGLMEAAAVLCDAPDVVGGFASTSDTTAAAFTLTTADDADPVQTVIRFLHTSRVETLSLPGSEFSTEAWGAPMRARDVADRSFPFEPTDSPAALPVRLVGPGGELPLEHWGDSGRSGRDNVKFWAGAAGYPGAALARDALACVAGLGDNALAEAAAAPFAFDAPQKSSFRFD